MSSCFSRRLKTAVSASRVRPVRHFDGSNYGAIWAQARKDHVHVVFWTWRKHRIVRTKAEGERLVRLWKKWHKLCGWEVRGNVASHPEIKELRACALRTIPVEDVVKIELLEV